MRKTKKRTASMLLVEVMMVILFFALSITVLIEGFAGAYKLSLHARIASEALAQAQNIAETLYAAQDPEETAVQIGLEKQGGEWVLEQEEIQYRVTFQQEGNLREMQVEALYGEESLLTLPCSRYVEVTP